MRCLKKYGRQWRPKQGKLGWQKQKEEEKKREREETKRAEAEEGRKKKPKKERMMEVKKVVEKWKIWDKGEEAAKSEEETKKLVLEKVS